MEDKSKNLEKRAWYRVLKVLYGLGWLLVLIVTLMTFLVVKPTGYINTYNSSVNCSNGKTYRLNNIEGVYKVGDKLSAKDEIIVKRICAGANYKREEAKAVGYTDQEINNYLDQKQVPYTLSLVENGNWRSAISWTLGAFFISAFLLDLLKNIVLYITMGKKFSYWWLISNKSSGEQPLGKEEKKLSDEEKRRYGDEDEIYFEKTHPGLTRKKLLGSYVEMNNVDYGISLGRVILLIIGLFILIFAIGAISTWIS